MHISHNRGLSRGFLRGSYPGQLGRGEESSSRFPSSMDYTTTTSVLREAKRSKNNLGRGFRLAQEALNQVIAPVIFIWYFTRRRTRLFYETASTPADSPSGV